MERMDEELSLQLIQDIEGAPAAPGCYLFRSNTGKVLYVGKAKLLRDRVRNYLRPDADGRRRIVRMVAMATSVEFVVTVNEHEALVLENNLIKLHRPRFNVALKDDRTFASVRIDTREAWPRARIVRKYRKDGATYVGPFASGTKLWQTMEAIKRIFPLRRCSDAVFRNRRRVCVYHDIGICCGPCVPGKVTPEAYRAMVEGMIDVLRGREHSQAAREVDARIEAQMQQAAARRDFEHAALFRDQLFALRATTEAQNVQLDGTREWNYDAMGLHREGERAQMHVLLYRKDKLVGSSTHTLEAETPDDELVEQFVARYYEGDRPIPPLVLLPVEVDDAEALGAYISAKAGFAVKVLTPARGQKRKVIHLANLNAEHALKNREDKQAAMTETLTELARMLELDEPPRRMECYDISHFQGSAGVGAGVSFVDGEPHKAGYRRYRIKTVEGNDDFASMEEVLRRRLMRAIKDQQFPDLIVIDGGPPQLDRVQRLFEELNVVGVGLIGLAKARDLSEPARSNYSSRAPRKLSFERVYRPGQPEPITLEQNAPGFLLMRLRDEAHRFAITYHRREKRKQALASGLDAIAGVGAARKRALIRHFGSPAGVKQANVEALMAVEGVSAALAQRIVAHFAKDQASQEG